MQWPFEQWGATAVLSGHEHLYERVSRDDNGDGTFMPYFITALGGATPVGFNAPIEGSQVRYNEGYGAMLIQASENSITFEFIAATGGTLVDSFTIDLPAKASSMAESELAPALPAMFETFNDPFDSLAVARMDYFV